MEILNQSTLSDQLELRIKQHNSVKHINKRDHVRVSSERKQKKSDLYHQTKKKIKKKVIVSVS